MHSRRLIFFTLLLAFGQATATEGHPDHGGEASSGPSALTYPPGKTVVELPMLGNSGRPLIEVAVNGNEPAVFALDTGTTTSVWLGARLPGVTGAAGVTMDVAGLRIEGVHLQTVAAAQLGDLPFQGILGTEAFSSLVVELDWHERVVRLHDVQAFEAPAGAMPVEVATSGGYVVARGTVVVGEVRQEVELFVDTGAGYALTLSDGRVAAPASLIPDSPVGKGLHGTITASVGRVDSLELGTTRLNRVVTYFVAPESMIMPPPFEAGIGFEVLKRFVVFLDLSRGRMLLQATDAVLEPFDFTTSGLKLQPGINPDGAAEVFGVVPGSPAAKAGIQAGDFIQVVNARPVAELGFDGLEDVLAGAPGLEVALEVRRGTATWTVRLTLQELL